MATQQLIFVDFAGNGCLKVYDDGPNNPENHVNDDTGVGERKRVKINDTVQWNAQAGYTLSISFPSPAPFAGNPPITGTGTNRITSGMVNGNNHTRHKYTIVLSDPATERTCAEDPQIIIDGMGGLDGKHPGHREEKG
jgi:hypothetical protein